MIFPEKKKKNVVKGLDAPVIHGPTYSQEGKDKEGKYTYGSDRLQKDI